jgi:hypothetical protein
MSHLDTALGRSTLVDVLTCVECGVASADGAIGWEAHLAYDPREDEAAFVVMFCPRCAAREFRDDTESTALGDPQEVRHRAQSHVIDDVLDVVRRQTQLCPRLVVALKFAKFLSEIAVATIV